MENHHMLVQFHETSMKPPYFLRVTRDLPMLPQPGPPRQARPGDPGFKRSPGLIRWNFMEMIWDIYGQLYGYNLKSWIFEGLKWYGHDMGKCDVIIPHVISNDFPCTLYGKLWKHHDCYYNYWNSSINLEWTMKHLGENTGSRIMLVPWSSKIQVFWLDFDTMRPIMATCAKSL